MTLRNRWVLMTTLPVALVLTGCDSKNGLSTAGFDSGTPASANSNPDTAVPISPADAGLFDTYNVRTPRIDAPPGTALFTVIPPSVDLGTIDVGVTSSPVVVTVTNVGTAPSGPLNVAVSGVGIIVSGCIGMILAPKASCTISVTARAVVRGTIAGTVEVGDTPGNTKRIAVSGISTGGSGRFTVAPSPLDLGPVLIGKTATGSILVTIDPVVETPISIVVSGSGFSRSASGTCTDTLVSPSCTIDVSFTAGLTSGPAKGTVMVSLGGVTKTVAVTATVLTPAKLIMTPNKANFMTVAGTPSSTITFFVANAGDAVSAIPTPTISGPNKDDFTFTSNCNKPLPGGAVSSCQVNVVYSPKSATSTSNAQATLMVAEPGTGGSLATASLAGTAVAPSSGGSCPEVNACGGDVVGTWEVKSSCLKASGPADVAYMGLTCVPNTAEITGTVTVSGTLTLGADGKYTDKTVTTGSASWVLDKSCTELSGTRVTCVRLGEVFATMLSMYGYETFSCQDAPSGGGCSCQGKINQRSGMGLLNSDPRTTGKYRTLQNTLIFDNTLNYPYCVNGTEMTVSPEPVEASPFKGTVVLQKTGG